tara:strand:+ start:357 stop:605 length:249 start_codon:yes stop_codon:yes gene_type:complete
MVDIFIATFGGLCIIATLISEPRAHISDKSSTDLEISAKALELYIQDKKDHDKYCPSVVWEQPALEVYKKTLESHLPTGCKK